MRIITVLKVHNIREHKSNIRKANITCCCHVEDRVESIKGNYRIEVSNSSCKRSQIPERKSEGLDERKHIITKCGAT